MIYAVCRSNIDLRNTFLIMCTAIRRELSEERKSKVEIREDLLREQKRRLDLEDCLDHANRRLDEYPVMVPAVQEALEMLSLLTEGVMLAVHGHGV